ncbi:MAG: hypothetical protein JWQ69_3571 [Pseudomonas sp.]|nr:hypothetical protein [Pseudomonas sp.]
MIAVVTQDPSVPSALPTVDSWDWFTSTHEQRAPAWKNQVTLRSVEMFLDYEPGAHIAHISPTPLLMIGALADHLTAAGGHFDSYTQDFEIAHSEAIQ